MRRFGFGLLVALASCGYSFGSGLEQHGVRTVALRVVGNQSFRQRLEVELTAALARELPVSTDLRLASAGRADASLEVTITDAVERTLVPGTRDDPVREGGLLATIRVRLLRADGQVLVDQILRERTEFRDPIGENLAAARDELATELARRIALALQSAP
ncbi:MAG: hypothetical protein JNK49_15620 [Planctomycetes bacterium]|nr:hypothetical protein [Planctomycetota bacterium]